MGYTGRGSVGGKSRVWDGAKWVETASGIAVPHDTTHNPVGLYQLDESLTDTSGNNNWYLSAVGGAGAIYTSIVPGIRGHGFDSYLRGINATPNLAITGDLTIEMIVIVYEVPSGTNQRLIMHGQSGETEATNVVYCIDHILGGGLRYHAEYDAGVDIIYDINDTLPIGIPVHLALVRSSNDVTFYMNGRQIGATSSGLNAPTGGSSGYLYLGLDFGNFYVLEGAIGSVKIISSALTAEQIRAEYNQTLGPIFGEQNSYSYRSATFNGSDEYVTMGNVLDFEYDDPFSISFWMKSIDAEAYPVSKLLGSTTYRGYGVALSSGQLYFSLINDNGGSVKAQMGTNATYNDGAWHHVVCTYSASTPGAVADMNIYVDGIDVPTTTASDTLGSNTISNSASFNIGSRTDGSVLFAGNMDEVAIYDKELSAAEVTWVYNQGKPQDLRGPAAPSNLIGWWRLGENASGTTIPDQSVNNNNGTMTNMTIAANITNDVPR